LISTIGLWGIIPPLTQLGGNVLNIDVEELELEEPESRVIFNIEPEIRMSEENKLLYNIFMTLIDIRTVLEGLRPKVEKIDELIEDQVKQTEEQSEQDEEQTQLSEKQYEDLQESYPYANITVPVSMQESKKSEKSKKKG